MPTLDQIRSSTTPVKIKRGAVAFTLDAALEKLTPDNHDYQNLREESLRLSVEADNIRGQLAHATALLGTYSNLEALREFLVIEATQGKTLSAVAEKKIRAEKRELSLEQLQEEAQKRLANVEERLDQIREAFTKNDSQSAHVAAKRLAYLVVGSDITDSQGNPVLSGVVEKSVEQIESDARVFVENFSHNLLDFMLEQVEAAVYGPLEMAG